MDKLYSWAMGGAAEYQDGRVFRVPSGPNSAYDIEIIPALSDNYMYLVVSRGQRKAVVVDPPEADKVLAICKAKNIELEAILTTHYHADHSGGNAQIAEEVPGIAVFAGRGDAERTPAVTRCLVNGEMFSAAGLPFRCIATPCHTRGHVSFFLDAEDGQAPALFCGDTLFVAGCGRFMEGTAADMRQSLDRLILLPPSTRLFCGHEYTVANLRFAASLEPTNQVIKSHLRHAEEKRKLDLPTVPSTLAEEAEHNPFLRVLEPTLRGIICPECAQDPLDAMSEIRRRKDTYTRLGTIITWALDARNAFTRFGEWTKEGPHACSGGDPLLEGMVCGSRDGENVDNELVVVMAPTKGPLKLPLEEE